MPGAVAFTLLPIPGERVIKTPVYQQKLLLRKGEGVSKTIQFRVLAGSRTPRGALAQAPRVRLGAAHPLPTAGWGPIGEEAPTRSLIPHLEGNREPSLNPCRRNSNSALTMSLGDSQVHPVCFNVVSGPNPRRGVCVCVCE